LPLAFLFFGDAESEDAAMVFPNSEKLSSSRSSKMTEDEEVKLLQTGIWIFGHWLGKVKRVELPLNSAPNRSQALD
jgi:hypothetical protein